MNHRPMLPRQSGMSLIEVLVSILVVSLGILVMIVMQVNASKLAKTSEFRAVGALLASDIADRMRANPQGVLDSTGNQYAFKDAYPTGGAVDVPTFTSACDATGCTPAQLAADDLLAWRRTVAFSLPGGWVRISGLDTSGGAQAVDMWLMWSDPAWADAKATAEHEPTGAHECPDGVVTASSHPRCMYFRINL